MAVDPFHITLVRSRIKSRPYAKIDGAYSGPTWNNNIGLQSVNPNTPERAFELLQSLQGHTDTCMVMGTAIRQEILDTDRKLTNFEEQPVGMLVLDLDKYPGTNMAAYGKEVDYYRALADADQFIKDHLPPEFLDTTYIIRFSASYLTGDAQHLRCHLVFLLEEPQYPREIGMWMKHDDIPADATFYFNLTQPIFTAAPVFRQLVDPLKLTKKTFPRISMVKRKSSHVGGNWQPYHVPKFKDRLDVSNLPSANRLPGKIGSFCRAVKAGDVLTMLGYEEKEANRYLAPSSDTGIPGAIVFENGFVFSHHEGDPLNTVSEKIHNFKRRSLNAYDLMHGWALVVKSTDPSFMKEFDFMMDQAVASDLYYQEEIQQELADRTDWLVEGGYDGANRKIVDSLLRDMHSMGISEMVREYIFNAITAKTKKGVTKEVLRSTWKNVRKDKAMNTDAYAQEALVRNMASLFKKQRILYAHHKTMNGDFWCYFAAMKMWKRCNPSQTQAFIYEHVHSSMPVKSEIDFHKTEQLTKIIMRDACLSITDFSKGLGWAFKGGRYGVLMKGLFSDVEWTLEESIKTLSKADHIYKELPITYEQWKNRKKYPEAYVDFLLASCEDDVESIELIREYGGYIISDSYFLHKMLILEGVPGSGKSILAKILQGCVGSSFHAAISIGRIASRFGLGDLPGKKLAVMSEARGADFNTLRTLVPILLKIIGQDYIDTEAKHKSAMSELLECKILMMTNRTPVIPDDTGALSQRLLMVRFDKCFRGTPEEILGLDKQILSDGLASIIYWHLKGLERLSKRKAFVEPESGLAAKRALLEQIDPLKSFIETFFDLDMASESSRWIVQKEFIKFFRAYLHRLGQYNPEGKALVEKRASIRNLKSLYPVISKRRMPTKEGDYKWKLTGLCPHTDLAFEFVDELDKTQ
ncbi:MAG: hypothetical protein GY820_16955 [Gammaproteobacteria bacterium]|nr:hypothetical protein [Gammaproteobacteria bacterium]